MQLDPAILAETQSLGAAFEQGFIAPTPGFNKKLRDAVEKCVQAESQIDAFIATVPPAEDPNNQTEVDALEWKKDQIRWQVERAVRAGKERKAHIATLRTDEAWEAELKRCGKDMPASDIAGQLEAIKHWFRYWAWAKDPRADYLAAVPFVPFGIYEDDQSDFQWRYITWLHETTFKRRKSGVVEKARDMGATLGWLLWASWCWLFKDEFTALLTSATEDLVDSKKDPDTLFEKVRYELDMQPPESIPEGFRLDRDMRSHMNLANPTNGAVLSGKAPTGDIGRQMRRKAVLKDESASWPFYGIPQATSLSAVSDSQFDVSSVKGRMNQFAINALHPSANKFVMDWRDHPWKDERWYNSLEFGFVTPAMTKETIAQEVDRDYDASQPGKVFKDWNEAYTCIEWPELLEFYKKHNLLDRFISVDGTLQVPMDWNWARMQDKGETDGHPRISLYCAVPGETWPLKDSVFFFIEHQAGTADDLGTVVQELTERQRELHLDPPRRPQMSLHSHEAKKDREIYKSQFGWKWDSWDTDYDSGIGNIRLWLKTVDTHLPNPIRPLLMGRKKMYLVCGNPKYPERVGQATLQWNEKDKKPFVSQPKDHYGFIRLRAEMPVYHYPPEEMGKPVKEQRPLRDFDDAIACVRGVAVKWGPKPKAETAEEKLIKQLAPDIRPGANVYEPGTPERDAAVMSRQLWMDEFKEEDKQSAGVSFGPLRVLRRTPTIAPKTRG